MKKIQFAMKADGVGTVFRLGTATQLGPGIFGGMLPLIATAIAAATGNIHYGLWYPIIVAVTSDPGRLPCVTVSTTTSRSRVGRRSSERTQ